MPDDEKIPRYVPALKLSTVSTATTYHFARVDRETGGWALCTVNDGTGELGIQSDWGSWSYRWSSNPKHLGSPSLTHFIAARGRCDYLADKLTSRTEREEFSADDTVRDLRKILCERRLEQGRKHIRDGGVTRWSDTKPYCGGRYEEPLTEGIARELCDALGGDLQSVDRAEVFCERFCNLGAYTWITDQPWEHLQHRLSSGYMVLLHGILPALRDACAAAVASKADGDAAVPS